VDEFLRATAIINWQNSGVLTQAQALAVATAQRCFEWVRDTIRHSHDYGLNPVTCSASEVLAAGTGYCYAKSHLLAALLRANGIPAGLCYQRLTAYDEGQYSLHGLNAVDLPDYGGFSRCACAYAYRRSGRGDSWCGCPNSGTNSTWHR
jgi:transglutaminase-like putative cysteine protease